MGIETILTALETDLNAALDEKIARRGESQSRYDSVLYVDNSYAERASTGTFTYHSVVIEILIHERSNLAALYDKVLVALIRLAGTHPIIRDTINVAVTDRLVADFEILDYRAGVA